MKDISLRFVRVIPLLLIATGVFTKDEPQAIAERQTDTKTAIQGVVSPGYFVGVVKTLWKEDGRNMTLLEDLSYVDPDGLEWKAPAGSTTDGASIPQMAWSIIGGPFKPYIMPGGPPLAPLTIELPHPFALPRKGGRIKSLVLGPKSLPGARPENPNQSQKPAHHYSIPQHPEKRQC